MAQSFDASHKAYESGDGAGAKHLSEEGKRHKAEMERLNQEASDWIYRRAYPLLSSPAWKCLSADVDNGLGWRAQRTTQTAHQTK